MNEFHVLHVVRVQMINNKWMTTTNEWQQQTNDNNKRMTTTNEWMTTTNEWQQQRQTNKEASPQWIAYKHDTWAAPWNCRRSRASDGPRRSPRSGCWSTIEGPWRPFPCSTCPWRASSGPPWPLWGSRRRPCRSAGNLLCRSGRPCCCPVTGTSASLVSPLSV